MSRRLKEMGHVLGGVAAVLIAVGCGSNADGSGGGTGGTGTGDSQFVSDTGGTGDNGGGFSSGGFSNPGSGGFSNPGAGGEGQLSSGGEGNVGSGGSSGSGSGGEGAGGEGAGGSGGTGGSESAGGAGGGTPAVKPPCITDPAEGVFIGDSYITGAGSPALQPALQLLVPSVTNFQNYAVPGTSLSSGGITGFIPPQLTSAIQQHPNLKFIIMDGGGNDILICNATLYPSCNTLCDKAGSSTTKVCTDIVAASFAVAKKMMSDAADAGVKDIVYFFYPHIPDLNGGFKEILDYAAPLAKSLCDSAFATTNGKLTCHFVDPRAAFAAAGGDMNPANFSLIDGIHPSQAGQNIMAGLIADKMKADCLDQASGSCCQ